MKVPSINNIDPTEIKINYKLNKINSICMHSKCMCLFMSIILYWRLDICMYVHITICMYTSMATIVNSFRTKYSLTEI